MPKLLLSINQPKIDEVISFIEDVIDRIDDHNEAVNPCKDIVTVSKARYRECFPQSAEVRDASATLIDWDCQKSPLSPNPPAVKKGNGQEPGYNYQCEEINNNWSSTVWEAVHCWQYWQGGSKTHEGYGDLPIPSGVVDNLFMLLSALSKHKREIEQEMAEVCQR